MALSASRLREDVYRILDSVLETGQSVEIERKGKLLRISVVEPAERPERRLEDLPTRDLIVGDPEDLVNIDWSQYWEPRFDLLPVTAAADMVAESSASRTRAERSPRAARDGRAAGPKSKPR